MAESLVIRLSDDPNQPVHWVVVNSIGQQVNLPMSGSLHEAAPFVGTRKVYVLVPSATVLVSHVELPPVRGSKLQQALPYALEEQLAQDVEDLHFAVGRQNADGSYPAAVVNREVMEAWRQVLDQASIHPKVMVPESCVIPAVPGDMTTIVIEGGQITCQQYGQPPVTFLDLSLHDVLTILEIGEDPETLENLTVFVLEEEQARVASTLEVLRRQVNSLDIQILANGTLPHLAVRAVQSEPIDLLQGDFLPRTSVGKYWQPWKFAASLAATFLVVICAGKLVQGITLAKEEARLDAAIDATFKQAFPGQRMQADLRRQVDILTRQTGSNTADTSFLQALGTVAASIAKAPEAQVAMISYRDGAMDLRIEAPDTIALEGIKDRISETGEFTVKIESADPKDENTVDGRLEVRRAGT